MSRKHRLTLAKLIGKYFGEYLQGESGLSSNTRNSYNDSVLLYLRWLSDRIGKDIDELDPVDMTSDGVKDFLRHLETDRGCCVRTRNQRLCGLRNFSGSSPMSGLTLPSRARVSKT